jgi:NAD(P)-dependent dehydrogenase (short-subunit alcohol dehydrogenase family)
MTSTDVSGNKARVIVVTGSASGIGAATVTAARSQGAEVIGVDLREADVCTDLATAAGREDLVDGVRAHSGGSIDAVVACAGVTSDAAVAVNYFGMVATLAGLRPLLVRSTAPRAVGVASLASIHPVDEEAVEACLAGDEARAAALVNAGEAGYATSKAALCRWIRRNAPSGEWAGAGIPLNSVSPGTVLTPMTAPFLATAEGTAMVDSLVPMPLHGHARPESVAALLLWLVSPANTHVTGQNIFIDGGADAVLRGDSVW